MAYTFHIVAQNVSTFEIAMVVNQSIMSPHIIPSTDAV